MATWTLSKIGAKHSGSCIVCRQSTSKVPLDVTPLYVTEAKEYGVAHPECVGAGWKRGISSIRITGTPVATYDSSAPKYAPSAEDMAKLDGLLAELRETSALAPAGKTWPAFSDLADALRQYNCGIADEIETKVALRKLAEKVDARRAQIPGRKIEID